MQMEATTGCVSIHSVAIGETMVSIFISHTISLCVALNGYGSFQTIVDV